uniref:HMG box domain-containing protein n=1 Tax=Stomoxys calcitrans TaxID=35570 RepID=A0A1I8Q397_STOCA
MTGIWTGFCDTLYSLVRLSTRKTRVSFSPSTLQREIEREAKRCPTNNPFLNFLAEVRARAMKECPLKGRDLTRISKTAGKMWKSMGDNEKESYRILARERRRLQGPQRRRRRLTARKRRRR